MIHGTYPSRLRALRRVLVVCAVMITAGSCVSPAAQAAVVPPTKTLVFGHSDNGFERLNTAATLRDLGIETDEQVDLPTDISGYSAIWYIGAYAGIPVNEQTALIDYVNAGGGLYLTGERPCCENLNTTVQNVLRGTLKDQDVQVGGIGDINGPFTFNTDVTDFVAQVPNLLVDFVPHSPGGMEGIGDVNSRNVFASNGAIAVGAIWPEADMKDGKGRIALLMDIDWLGDPDRVPIISNLENFLTNGGSCSDGGHHAGFLWTGPSPTNSPKNCSTITTPATIQWKTGSDVGPITMTVTPTNADAICDVQQGPGNVATASCQITNATATGATLRVSATDSAGTSTRYYRLRPLNDPRNVPVPFGEDSEWWTWPDADKDGLPDHWEINGVWVKNKHLDLPALGADANHRDFFVQYDYQEGSQPTQGMFDEMKKAYANSPLSNPDGTTGVTLHVTLGESVPPSVAGSFTTPGGHDRLTGENLQRIGTYTGFLNSPRYGGAGVPQIFRWMFNFDTTGTGTIGTAFIKGTFGFTAYDIPLAWGKVFGVDLGGRSQEMIDFMHATNAVHELGHTLGLDHHGAYPCNNHAVARDDAACEEKDSRYKSVMSYSYNTTGVPSAAGNVADYSRVNVVNLDWQNGKDLGRISWVHGQFGEDPNFYVASNSETIDLSKETPTEPTIDHISRTADPEAVRQLIQTYDVPADPVFPTVSAPTTATVVAGQSVVIPVTGASADGGPTSIEASGGELGTAVAIPAGVRYTAAAGPGGEDTVTVRALNESLSSEDAEIAMTVAPATGGGSPSTPDPVTPPPVTPAPVTPAPFGPSSIAPPVPLASDTEAPRLTGTVRVTLGARVRGKRRPAFTFRLSETASLRIRLTRAAPGARSGRRCVAPPKRARPGMRRCTRSIPAGTVTRRFAVAGAVRLRVLAGALRRGSYIARLMATDAAGNRSRTVSVRFRVT
ncbi:MAG: hypothetical protein Q8K82_00405 [Gemmatimonadaceae bacterium]|nr:hypothetical protein [Gemmatimonadaceae bacterium]